ncbi:Hpt domain-containing protein [Methylobacterium sp. NEAU 140]|uniref:Hpt domain-containing protein n=1 Tax=Methylobacterium sp. NEAU 140 TaxID=3064945 RepID=UPI002735CD88|nr:Hpt domain-containing protein [Methylobacterium sp. NEAU 140]MDP4025715.1 Hpt domain-containing protein [Methylobacterium sp. NEAU 140]
MSLPLVSRSTLDELADVIGREKLDRLVDRFVESLGSAFAGPAGSGDACAREAHTLISMSGMLGCEALSQACRDLEQQAKAGGDVSAPLTALRALRDRTVAELRAMRAEAGPAR